MKKRSLDSMNEVIIHCAVTRPNWMDGAPVKAKADEIKRWHVEHNGWSDIGYHYVIDRDGSVAKGRPLDVVGAHVRGRNEKTIGVCLLGGFGAEANDEFSDHFTPAQDVALRDLIAELQNAHGPLKVSGHNEYAAKGCPGFQVDRWVKMKPKRKMAESKTLQASSVGTGSLLLGSIPAIAQLDGTVQLIFAATVVIALLSFVIVFRERIKGWVRGWR